MRDTNEGNPEEVPKTNEHQRISPKRGPTNQAHTSKKLVKEVKKKSKKHPRTSVHIERIHIHGVVGKAVVSGHMNMILGTLLNGRINNMQHGQKTTTNAATRIISKSIVKGRNNANTHLAHGCASVGGVGGGPSTIRYRGVE